MELPANLDTVEQRRSTSDSNQLAVMKILLRLHAIDQHYTLFTVDLPQPYFHDFCVTGLHAPAHVLRFDGHFTMAAINHHTQGHALWPSQIEQAVHRGANGPPGI